MDGGGQVKVMKEAILEPILPEEPIVGPKLKDRGQVHKMLNHSSQ